MLFAGVTGIALAMAGASTVLTDLQHITPLTQSNLECNVGANQSHAKVTVAFSTLCIFARLPSLVAGTLDLFNSTLVQRLVATVAHTSQNTDPVWLYVRRHPS